MGKGLKPLVSKIFGYLTRMKNAIIMLLNKLYLQANYLNVSEIETTDIIDTD